MLKKLTVVVLALFLGTPLAVAQWMELAGALGGYVINRKLSESERKEFGSAKIVFNVYYVGDGQRTFKNIWDPSTGTACGWNRDVELVPVVGINEANSPREVQWAISNEQGPIMKQQYNAVKGGKRGKDGEAVDNGGYIYAPYSLKMWTMPKGVIFVHAAWGGKGKSTTVMLINMDVSQTQAVFTDPENQQLRQAFAGAGHSTFPVIPVISAVIDGQLQYFLSKEELELFVANRSKARQGATPPPAVGNGNPPVRQIEHGNREVQPPVGQTTTPLFDIRLGGYNRDDYVGKPKAQIYQELAGGVDGKPSLPEEFNEIIRIPDGSGVAILVKASEQFTAKLLDKDGNESDYSKTVVYDDSDKLWAFFIPLNYSSTSDRDSRDQLVLTNLRTGQKRTIRFERGTQ